LNENNSDDFKNYIFSNQPFIMLNNAIIYKHIKKMSIKELKESKMMLSDFFKLSGIL
jgi:hypothetical protein